MATTQHYGLHQWEAGDHFLRTDFNEDFTKIDTGISAAKRAADQAMDALTPVSYNVYNLILQQYYEGKQTGYKRALLFDGFVNNSGIERITGGGGYDQSNRRLSTSLTIDTGSGLELTGPVATMTNAGIVGYQPFFCSQGSTLNGVTIKLHTSSFSGVSDCAVRVALVGWSTGSNRPDGRVLANSEPISLIRLDTIPKQLRFPLTCALDANTYALRLEVVSTTGHLEFYGGFLLDRPSFLSADYTPANLTLAYRLELSPASGSPTLYTRAVSAGVPFRYATGYVCHSQGNIALTMTDRSGAHPMALAGSRYVTTPDGVSCVEKQLSLDLGALDLRDPIKFELGFQTGYVYSYGVMLF